MNNYVVAFGGSGSRCAEAFLYLAAAGIVRNPTRVLIVDPDQTNGNSSRFRELLKWYAQIHRTPQPDAAKRTNGQKPPRLFESSFNGRPDGTVDEAFWRSPYPPGRTFRQAVEYTTQPDAMKKLLDLLYPPEALDLVMGGGYAGKPNVGAVALKLDLAASCRTDPAIRAFLGALNADIQNHDARIFVFGSVFGGTGAAGLPTLPALLQDLEDDLLSTQYRQRMRMGCAMLTPYFAFPRSGQATDPTTDSANHALATQAALLHYARVPTGYQHVYLIGAPEKATTNERHAPRGEQQMNSSHYVELVAAIAAWDFLERRGVEADDRQLHFANSIQSQKDIGVRWETLPLRREPRNAPPALQPEQSGDFRRRLIGFTTFAYFYKNFLHDDFVRENRYAEAPWYTNFHPTNLHSESEVAVLQALNSFAEKYVEWLRQIGHNGGKAIFRQEPLESSDPLICNQWVGGLVDRDDQPPAEQNGFNEIMARMTRVRLRKPDTKSAAGLLISMLDRAVDDYNSVNYSFD
jgi:hypothetical protein